LAEIQITKKQALIAAVFAILENPFLSFIEIRKGLSEFIVIKTELLKLRTNLISPPKPLRHLNRLFGVCT